MTTALKRSEASSAEQPEIAPSLAAESRRYEIHDHVSVVASVSATSGVLDVWGPVIPKTPYRRVLDMEVTASGPWQIHREAELGNLVFHRRIALPADATPQMHLRYVLERVPVLPRQLPFPAQYPAGTIVVDTTGRFLYLVEGAGFARRCGVSVGRAALAWSGTAEIGKKAEWPSWRRAQQPSWIAGPLPIPQWTRYLLSDSRNDGALDHRPRGVERVHPIDQRARRGFTRVRAHRNDGHCAPQIESCFVAAIKAIRCRGDDA